MWPPSWSLQEIFIQILLKLDDVPRRELHLDSTHVHERAYHYPIVNMKCNHVYKRTESISAHVSNTKQVWESTRQQVNEKYIAINDKSKPGRLRRKQSGYCPKNRHPWYSFSVKLSTTAPPLPRPHQWFRGRTTNSRRRRRCFPVLSACKSPRNRTAPDEFPGRNEGIVKWQITKQSGRLHRN